MKCFPSRVSDPVLGATWVSSRYIVLSTQVGSRHWPKYMWTAGEELWLYCRLLRLLLGGIWRHFKTTQFSWFCSPQHSSKERGSWSERGQCAATHILWTNQLFFVGLTAGVSKAEWFMSGHRKKPLACRSVELAVVSAGNAPLDYYFSKQSGTMQCKHRIETFGQWI